MSQSAALPQGPIHGRLNADLHLLEADDALHALHRAAGGQDGQPFAVPALAALARLAQRLRIPISRSVEFVSRNGEVSAWLQLRPEADGYLLSLSDWQERPIALPDTAENVIALALEAPAGTWRWQIDARLRFRAADTGDHAPGHPLPNVGQPLTAYFLLDDGHAGEGDNVPLVEALARRAPFNDQPAVLRADPDIRYLISGLPLFDAAGQLAGYRGHARRVADAHAEPDVPLTEDIVPEAVRTPVGDIFGPELGRRLDQALRQPIGRIIANASSISSQLEGPLSSDYVDYAADIAMAGRHLMELVDDLADLRAIERPGFTTAREEVDLADLGRRAAGLLNVRANSRKIRILTPAVGEHAPATAEYRRVLQILVNLVGNAVRYAPDGSQIWLRVELSDGRARVTVADQGRGIDPADHERVFGRFERINQEEGGGSGLGLYISRRLARAMGGDVTLESAPGQGARFTLDLPEWVVS
jgi:signal transduction histidine kinase